MSETQTDVLVIGEGFAALQSALDFAEVGLRVTVVSDGTIDDGLSDAGVDSQVTDTSGAVAALITRVQSPLSEQATQPNLLSKTPENTRLIGNSGAAAQLPTPHVWGIPASPLSSETAALLGAGRAIRVYMDRLTPLLTIGKVSSLGELVRRRLGPHALRLLTVPLVTERFGVHPNDVEVALAAPGLNEALTRAGSLTGAALAYSLRLSERETTVAPSGGWNTFRDALRTRLEHYGVRITSGRVSALERLSEAASEHLNQPQWRATLGHGEAIAARAIVVSADADLADGAADLLPQLTETGVTPLRTEYVRVCAEATFEAHTPDRANSDARYDADATAESHGALLQIVQGWSVRSEADGRLVLRGPRTAHNELATQTALEQQCTEIVAAAGIESGEQPRWRFRVAAAPFVTVAEREAAAVRVREWSAEHPSVLVVGRSLYGDDFSAAVSDAHASAVELRRRLLGITQD